MATQKESGFKVLRQSDFPHRLREINDPPEKLYLEGTLPPETHKWLCVVGSRKYSDYGRRACEELIAGLAGHKIVIVSGLALGTDAIAHQAALHANLPTVAIPGSGLDRKVLYPAGNRPLAEEILKRGGALLTEFEPDFRATAWSFPQRNRIMAGLSDAVLVIEAETRSGTLITSRLATEYNRDVFTVPGSIFSSTAAGPHLLIRLGATPITSSEELLQALGFQNDENKSSRRDRLADCSDEEKRVIELLDKPVPRDELIQTLRLTTSQANTLLGAMEVKGLIRESLGEIHLVNDD